MLVVARKNQRVHYRLGVARLDLLARAVCGIKVKRLNLFPNMYTLLNAVEHGSLCARWSWLTQFLAQNRPRQPIGRLSVAGDAIGSMVFLRTIPPLPPHFAVIQIPLGGLPVPAWRPGRVRLVRSQNSVTERARNSEEQQAADCP